MGKPVFEPFDLTLANSGRDLLREDGVLATEWHFFSGASPYRQLVVLWEDKQMRSYNVNGYSRGVKDPMMGLAPQRNTLFAALLTANPLTLSAWYPTLAALRQDYPDANQGYRFSVLLDGTDPVVEYIQK